MKKKDYRIRKETQANGKEWFYIETHNKKTNVELDSSWEKGRVGYPSIEEVKQAIMNRRASDLANASKRIVSTEIIEY